MQILGWDAVRAPVNPGPRKFYPISSSPRNSSCRLNGNAFGSVIPFDAWSKNRLRSEGWPIPKLLLIKWYYCSSWPFYISSTRRYGQLPVRTCPLWYTACACWKCGNKRISSHLSHIVREEVKQGVEATNSHVTGQLAFQIMLLFRPQ